MAKDLKNTRDYVLTKHIPDLFEVGSLLILLCIALITYKYFGNFGSRYNKNNFQSNVYLLCQR